MKRVTWVVAVFLGSAAALYAGEKQLRADGWKDGQEPKIGGDGPGPGNLGGREGTRIERMEWTLTTEPSCSPYRAAHPGPRK